MPSPQVDLRHQLKYLAYRIEELILSENEAQFFLIHTTASDKKRAKKHELEMIVQERKTCELALQNFEQTIQSLNKVVRKNAKDYEEQSYLNMEYRLQAEATAQSLARAQIRLQERSPNVSRKASGSGYSVTSSATSVRSGRTTAYYRDSLAGGSQYSGVSSVMSYSHHPEYVNSFQDLRQQISRSHQHVGYEDMVPPTPTSDFYYNARESVNSTYPTPPPSALPPQPQQQQVYASHEQNIGFLDDFGFVDDEFELGVIDPQMNYTTNNMSRLNSQQHQKAFVLPDEKI